MPRWVNVSWRNFPQMLLGIGLLIGGLIHPLSPLLQQAPPAPISSVTALDYSSDGKLLAVGYNLGQIDIFTSTAADLQNPLTTLNLVGQVAAPDLPTNVRSLAWKPGSHLLAVALSPGPGLAWVIIEDIDKQTKVASFQVTDAGLIWSPDGSKLALIENGQGGAENSYILVWDTTKWSQIAQMWGKTNGVISISWSRDSKELVSSSFDSSVVVWDVANQQIVHTIRPSQEEPDMTLSPAVPYAAWSPDSKLIAIGDGKGVVEAWNVSTWQLAWQLTNLSQRVGNRVLAWSPNGQLLAVTDYDEQASNQVVQILNGQTGTHARTYTLSDIQYLNPNAFRWTPDGANVVTGGTGRQLTALSLNAPLATSAGTLVPQKLILKPICGIPGMPATYPLSWVVENPNNYEVDFTWEVVGTGQTGYEFVASKGSDSFGTPPNPNGPNTVRIYVNGVLQDEKTNDAPHCTH